MIDLLNLSESDLQLVLDNAYAFPSDIQMQIKLNLHKMIGDTKYLFSKENSLYKFLLNNVPSCECISNIDAITTQKEYSTLYYMIKSYVTDSVFRVNLLNALSAKCYDLKTFSECIKSIESACTGYADRLDLIKKPTKNTSNEFNFALEVIWIKIKNLEDVSGILSGEIKTEYFSMLWRILKSLTDNLLNEKTTPDIFEQIAAIRVLLYRPLSELCYYNATWDRLYFTSYLTYLRFENKDFANFVNKQTLKLWEYDIVDLLDIISRADIKGIFDTSKILQTDYANLDTNILSSYEVNRNTLIWSKDITGEDKENAEKFKSITLRQIGEMIPRFISNCSFKLTDSSLAFLKEEFPDIKFIKLIWDGVGEKNIRTVVKYEDSYYILFEDSDNNIFALSQLDSTGSAKLINFSKNDADIYKVVSNFEDFEKGE